MDGSLPSWLVLRTVPPRRDAAIRLNALAHKRFDKGLLQGSAEAGGYPAEGTLAGRTIQQQDAWLVVADVSRSRRCVEQRLVEIGQIF